MNHTCSCAVLGTTENKGWKDKDIYFPAKISVARESHLRSGFVGAVMWLSVLLSSHLWQKWPSSSNGCVYAATEAYSLLCFDPGVNSWH